MRLSSIGGYKSILRRVNLSVAKHLSVVKVEIPDAKIFRMTNSRDIHQNINLFKLPLLVYNKDILISLTMPTQYPHYKDSTKCYFEWCRFCKRIPLCYLRRRTVKHQSQKDSSIRNVLK